jgi:hypothetical protein
MDDLDAQIHALVDREIMLTCLAAAAEEGCSEDFQAGHRARRLLDARLSATRARRLAAAHRAQARAKRAARAASPSTPPADARPPRNAALLNDLAMGRLVLEVRRAELWAHCEDAAELRSSASALRAQAAQVRRRAQDHPS